MKLRCNSESRKCEFELLRNVDDTWENEGEREIKRESEGENEYRAEGWEEKKIKKYIWLINNDRVHSAVQTSLCLSL